VTIGVARRNAKRVLSLRSGVSYRLQLGGIVVRDKNG
jgi:hypothetical protein